VSVFVDPLMNHGWCFRGKHIESCHMFSDLPGRDGLMDVILVGQRIGLKPAWVHLRHGPIPHFDINSPKRERAVEVGAIEVTRREAVNIWRALRGAPPLERMD